MLHTGIYRRSQVETIPAREVSEVVCSFRLLSVPRPSTPADIEVFEKVIRKTRLSNLVYRTTYRGRTAELDLAVLPILLSAFDPRRRLAVEDRAASDCLASSEWAAQLWPHFPQAAVTASDLHCHFIEAGRPWRGTYIFEEDGAPLQHVIPPFVIPFVRPLPARWLAARAVSQFSRRGIAAAWSAARQASWSGFLDDRIFDVDGWKVGRIRLIHPEAIDLMSRNPAFRVERRSIFDAAHPPVHVLRSMNILNAHYFTEPDLRRGIRAVFDSLVENGIWIVGRTREDSTPENHVSIWQKKEGGFRLLERIRDGSEIDGVILRALPA